MNADRIAEIGRCIICGREHVIERDRLISETTGLRVAGDDFKAGPWWMHADGTEATACDLCNHDPERVIAAHRLLTATGAVVPMEGSHV